MNAGKNRTKARAQAQANADRSQSPRWLHQYGGSWWISTTPTADAERVDPATTKSRHHATKKSSAELDREIHEALTAAGIPGGAHYNARQRAVQAEAKLDAIPPGKWSRTRVMAILSNVDNQALREIERRHLTGGGVWKTTPTAGRQVAQWAREVLDVRGA